MEKQIKSICLYTVLVVSLLINIRSSAQPVVIDKVVSVVGDNIILLSDIELQMQQAKSQGERITPNLKCLALDQIILEKFFLAQAQLDSLYISDDEIEAELDKRIRYFITTSFGSQEKLEEYYGKTVSELKDDFRKDVKSQMLAERMQGKIYGSIKTTPAEVREFFESIPKDSLPYFNSEIEISQIVVFPKVSDELKQYAYNSLKKIRNDILKGDDFSTKARLYSDDPGSKLEGGDLGFINRGEMVTEFEAAAFSLTEGSISDIIETQFGYHIIKCLERKGERVHVQHILISPKTTSYDEQLAKAKIDSVKKMIDNKEITFEIGVKEFSEDEQSKSNNGLIVNPTTGTSFFEMSQIDASMLFALSGLKVGQFSSPVPYDSPDGKRGYRIIKLVSETQPHAANLRDDYSKIQAAAKQAKQQEALVKWIKEKKGTTYINISDEWQSCDVIEKWLN